MRNRGTLRALAVLVGVLVLAVAAAGCGSNSKDADQKSATGTAPGATGDQAGGFAVEAGKKRSPGDAASDAADPPPVQVLVGNQTGIHVNKPTVIVVHSEKEFNALKKRQFSHGTPKQTMISTDYSDRQILGLFLPKSPKGTLLSITSVQQEDGQIVVKAVKLIPGKGCKTGDYVARPFHIVETGKMTGTPKIELSNLKQPSC